MGRSDAFGAPSIARKEPRQTHVETLWRDALRFYRLLLESADVRDDAVHLVWRQLGLESWHVLLHAVFFRVDTVQDGRLQDIIALRLVRGGCHVLNLELLSLLR